MLYSIDRFEGDLAVLCDEEENTCTVPRTCLPENVAAGDLLCETPEGFIVDAVATATRREQVRHLQQTLRRSQ